MTQTPKQWTTTGFLFGALTAIAVVIGSFSQTRSEPVARAAQAPRVPTLISGTIELDASAKVALPAIVFVIARGTGGGHPVLAKRLDVSSFPVTFTLGPEDSMMGQKPPGHVSLEARVDLDGDASTRELDAPLASLDSVVLGTNDVKLILNTIK